MTGRSLLATLATTALLTAMGVARPRRLGAAPTLRRSGCLRAFRSASSRAYPTPAHSRYHQWALYSSARARRARSVFAIRGAARSGALNQEADAHRIIVSGLDNPNGVAFANRNLYVAEVSRVTRFDEIEARLDKPPVPVVFRGDSPTSRCAAGSTSR